jgi:hypothetical protein
VPGAYTVKPFVYKYWDKVLIFFGDLIVSDDESGKGGEKFEGYTLRSAPARRVSRAV